VPLAPTAPSNPGQSCFDAGTVTCYADAGGGGLTSVFFVNAPLPPASTSSDRAPFIVALAVLALVIVGGVIVASRRRGSA
jgi:hypothetical protein